MWLPKTTELNQSSLLAYAHLHPLMNSKERAETIVSIEVLKSPVGQLCLQQCGPGIEKDLWSHMDGQPKVMMPCQGAPTTSEEENRIVVQRLSAV